MAQIILEFVGQDNASGAAKSVIQSVEQIEGAAKSASSGIDVFGEIAKGALRGIGEAALNAVSGGLSALGGIVSSSINEAAQWQSALAQTEAVVKSTGGAAGFTAEQMGNLAAELSAASGMSLFSDDAILGAQNVLATFTNVKDLQFETATSAILDISQALGTDLKSASIQVGKALNDPINGVSALSRVGVSFTEQQKEQIKTLQEAGDIAGAQAVILGELNKEFGGSAAAAVNTYAGQMTVLSEQFNDVKQGIGEAIMPLLQKLGQLLVTYAVPAVEQIAGAFISFVDSIDWAAVFDGISTGFSNIAGAITSIDWASIVSTISDLAIQFYALLVSIDWAGIANLLMNIGNVIYTTVAGAFAYLQPIIQLVIDTITPLIPQVIAIGAALVAAFQSPAVVTAFEYVKTAFALIAEIVILFVGKYWQQLIDAVNNLAPYFQIAFDAIVGALNYVMPIINGLLSALAQYLSGDVSGAMQTLNITMQKAWISIKLAVISAIVSVSDYLDGLKDKFLTAGSDMIAGIVKGIKTSAGAVQDALLSAVSSAWESVKSFLGIASPSRLMAETVGVPFAQGIAAGIAAGIPDITGAARVAGTAAAGATVNNYYNLTANYANTQSESTILSDLRMMQSVFGGA